MGAADLPKSLLAHSQFFDRLVNLVPARFYHSEETPLQNLKYLKKDAREQEKTKRKIKAKAAKRAKLNPDTAQTALDVQQNGFLRAGAEPESTANDEAEPSSAQLSEQKQERPKPLQAKALHLSTSTGKGASMDDLRLRLQNRLQILREKRRAEERKKHADEAMKWREDSLRAKKGKSRAQSGKRKASEGPQPDQAPAQADPVEPKAEYTFGQLTFDQGSEQQKKKRQKKASKAELLQEAESRTADREKLAASAEGQAQLGKSAWSSALSRAKGERILDDPKLLRKSLKKEQREKEKKSAAWKERQQWQKKEGRDRQKKRKANLQARVTAKQQKKKDLREKKLMRPGFEGRRDSFINNAE